MCGYRGNRVGCILSEVSPDASLILNVAESGISDLPFKTRSVDNETDLFLTKSLWN